MSGATPATDSIRSAGSAQGECRASLSLGSAAESCLSVAETLGFFHSDNILKRSKVPTWTEQWSRSCVVKVSIRGVRQKNDQDLGDERTSSSLSVVVLSSGESNQTRTARAAREIPRQQLLMTATDLLDAEQFCGRPLIVGARSRQILMADPRYPER
jgi:hypothetical protein